MTYVVAWTGGYEMPQFFGTADRDEALEKFASWQKDCTENSDVLTVLQVDSDGTLTDITPAVDDEDED